MKNFIRFLVLDVDGTLTDGKIYMGDSGEVFKAFNIKDGCGIKDILPQLGVIPIIITARNSKSVSNRCDELEIVEVHQGTRRKLECLQKIISKYSTKEEGYTLSNVAYIGDDILDLQCMLPIKEVGGIIGCPADAAKEVLQVADFVSCKNGGDGAVREFIEWLDNNFK